MSKCSCKACTAAEQLTKPQNSHCHHHDHNHEQHCHCQQVESHEQDSCGCEGHEHHNHHHDSHDPPDEEEHHRCHDACCEHDHGEEHCSCKACVEGEALMKQETHQDEHNHDHGEMKKIDFILYGISVACFVLAFLPIPEIVSTILFGACVLLAGYDLLWNGIKGLFHLKFEEDTLMTIAAVAAFALGEHPEACMVVLLFKIGEFLEQVAIKRSRKNLKALTEIRPDTANRLLEDGTPVPVKAEEIQIGEKILVRAGDKVPLDCVVLSGHSAIDSSALTGESIPVPAETGSQLLSGSINLSGALTCQVNKTFENSTASQILNLVYASSEKKGKTEKFITRFSKLYTPIVIICGILLAVVPPLLGILDFKTWILRSLIFLVASCPCALVISVPLSFFSSIGAISKQGILIKGTKYVETLSKIDCVAMDKTGTITSGKIEVERIDVMPGFTQEQVYTYAAAVEQYSNHPISQAICDYTQKNEKLEVSDVNEIAGFGVSAIIDGQQILCGNQKLLARYQMTPKTYAASYLCIDGKIAGMIYLKETIPQASKTIVQELEQNGVQKVVMLTGDSSQAAKTVAEQCGISEYHASLLPQDKVEQLQRLKTNHTVAFVGDGINDAPVLASADLGISMGLGSEIANNSSDVVIMGNQLQNLPKAIHLAKRSMGVVKFNIAFALLIKLIVIILVAIGLAPMWLGVFADTGVTILAMLNSVRIFSFVRKKKYSS